MSSNAERSIKLYGRKYIKKNVNWVMNILSLGLVYVVCRISTKCKIYFKTTPCSLDESECIVLEDQYKRLQIIELELKRVKPTLALKRYIKNKTCRILNTCYGRFIYDYVFDKFVLPHYSLPCVGKGFEEILQERFLMAREEEMADLYEKSIIYGSNSMNIRIPKIHEIFLDNIINPFFIWELCSVILWILIPFYSFACIVGPIYLIMLIVNIRNDLRNRDDLIKSLKVSEVKVLRGASFRRMNEVLVLPGDIIYINYTDSFTCDVQILQGDVITDESFLTGESVPICKGIGSVVYSGTKIIKSKSSAIFPPELNLYKFTKVKNIAKDTSLYSQSEQSLDWKFEDLAIGVVLKTGKQTKRGMLFRNFASKKPSNNEFMEKSNIVIRCLICFVLVLMACFAAYFYRKCSMYDIFVNTSDLGLTFFNPALYTCLQLGLQYSKNELLLKKISTTDITRINTAGEVDLTIFDKTGTLTELGVDIQHFDTITETIDKAEGLDVISRMALSSCHHVLELDSQYSGDMLDMKMFLFSQSKIINKDGKRFIEMEVTNKYEPICKEYSGNDGNVTLFFNAENSSPNSNDTYPEDTLEVLKIYDFDLYLKRLSTVVKNHRGQSFVFCKGAPDAVSKILDEVPKTYFEKVKEYGLQGHRVLTVAYKEIVESPSRREADESNLRFLGFLIFANKLKEETSGVIKELRDANLSPKMCTGDNILTAISVAKECGMIDVSIPVLFPVMEDDCKSYYDVDWFCVADEDYIFDKLKLQLHSVYDRDTTYDFVIAIESKEYALFKNTCYQDLIMDKAVIFARFTPDNKKDLVEQFSENGFVTLFCGDGANDTGALSSADVGVSLATNEATLAASFNSLSLNSVLDVIKEGRSALASSSAQFKYILYSQILAGLQIAILLSYFMLPSSNMSFVNDIMSCYVLGYSLSNFKAGQSLTINKFKTELFEDSVSIVVELLFVMGCFLCSFYFISEPFQDNKITFSSKKSTCIFFSTGLLLITSVFRFANFGPYRESWKTNTRFLLCGLGCFAVFTTLLASYCCNFSLIVSLFEFQLLDSRENLVLFFNLLCSFLISCLPFKLLVRSFVRFA